MPENERLVQLAAGLNIPTVRRHIFLCADQTTPNCATREAGLQSWDFLKARLKELNLSGPEPLVYRTNQALENVSAAARSLRELGDYLQRNPSAIVRGPRRFDERTQPGGARG